MDQESFEKQCHAKSKQSGRRCRNSGVRQNLEGEWICKMHGGNNPGRPIKHGRYSQVLGPLAKAYTNIIEGEDLKALEPILALMDVQLEKLIEKAIKYKESPEWRQEALKGLLDLEEALQSNDPSFPDKLDALKELLEKGVEADEAMDQVIALAERRAVRTERAVEIDLKKENTVTQQQVTAMLALICEIVVHEAGDRSSRIIRGIDKALKERAGISAKINPN